MTELGEPIAIGIVMDEDIECPFDHDEPQPPKVDNDLIGKGSTLASRMKAGRGTHLYSKIKDDYPVDKVLNPKHDSQHRFYKKRKVVEIDIQAGEETVKHLYPVSCAAHHLIPAQESLKESKLLAWMCKKGDSEPLKDGSYGKGVVWSDVGYDVNGTQNGVYLPGSYAVGGGRGGMKVWSQYTQDPEEEEEAEDSDTDPNSNLLDGPIPDQAPMIQVISHSNRKWLYVRQAMDMAPGQFHDRHQDYSEFIGKKLNKLASSYNNQRKKQLVNEECSKCKERAKKIEKLGIPTPYGLVNRLNIVSDEMRNHLTGPRWPINIYTSKWCRDYMQALKEGHSGAK